jgi:SAM-dependent methyltransferase
MKTFLHVGCGGNYKSHLKGFNNDNWTEIRLDIDKDVNPDIVGTLTDMNSVPTGSVDAVYSAHNIEHIYPHEVPIALKEFHRVLKEHGMVVLTCPDLESVCEAILQDGLLEPIYESPGGPISPIDTLFGWRARIEEGNEYMAHKGGFTYPSINEAFSEAGFKVRIGGRRPTDYELWIVAFKQKKPEEEIKKIALQFIPEAKLAP